MSVLRQMNFLGNMRVDAPHLRAVESAVAADFDVLAGRVVAGSKPLVIRGFTLSNFAAGTPASSVQLNVANAILMNVSASESGTFLWVPSNRSAETLDSATNSRVYGSFAANQINYVGLDLSRKADSNTSDLIQVLDSYTLLEEPRTAPLGRTLDYVIVISTVPFSAQPNLVPIAKIKTDGSNQIAALSTDVEDARNLAFRLGSGGDFPNRNYGYSFPEGRKEFNTVTGSTVGQFVGGDKSIPSQKDWMDAVMTRIWEIGGGENWYSPVADRNLMLGRDSGNVFASNGENFEYVAGDLHWRGLSVVFENSNGTSVFSNTVTDQTVDSTGLTDIVAGECIYVDLDRTQTAALVAQKAAMNSLGVPSIPGSRVVLAWCVATGVIMTRNSPYPVNTTMLPATTTAIGGVRLNVTPDTPGTPTVVTLAVGNGAEIGSVTYPVTTGSALTLTSDATGTAVALTIVGDADGTGLLINHNHATTASPSLSVINFSNGNNAVYAESNSTLPVLQARNNGAGDGLLGYVFSGAGAGVRGRNGGAGPAIKTQNTGTGYGLEATADNNHAIFATQSNNSYRAVHAVHTGSGRAIQGVAANGIGVRAESTTQTALVAISDSGNAANVSSNTAMALVASNSSTTDPVIYASNAANGTANAIFATISSTDGTAIAAKAENTGTGSAFKATAVSGYAAWGVSGSSTSAALLNNTGSGSCLDLANTGTGVGMRITTTDATKAAISLLSTGAGNNIRYNAGLSAKHVLGGSDFKLLLTPSTLTVTPPTTTSDTLKANFTTASDTAIFYTKFRLPVNAVITSVSFRLTHSGTAGSGLASYVNLQKTRRAAGGWTHTNVLNVASATFPLNAAATSETFTTGVAPWGAITISGTPTVTDFEDAFAIRILAQIGASVASDFAIDWCLVEYTLYDLLPV